MTFELWRQDSSGEWSHISDHESREAAQATCPFDGAEWRYVGMANPAWMTPARQLVRYVIVARSAEAEAS